MSGYQGRPEACAARNCTLLLAGSNPLALAYLRQFLSGAQAPLLCPTAASLAATVRRVSDPVAVTIDLGSLGVASAAWFDALHRAMPSARILAVDGAADAPRLCHLFTLGLHGFVTYDDVETRLNASLALLVAGHLVFPHEVLERIAEESRHSRAPSRRRGLLTGREAQVLELVRGRLSNKEIGSALGLSERTVRFHLRSVFTKLGVDNRHSAAEAFARLVALSPASPFLRRSRPLSRTTGVPLSFVTTSIARRDR